MAKMSKDPCPTVEADRSSGDSRRSFFALVLGALATLPPLVVGLVSFFSPLGRRATSSKVRVALLAQVPDDGRPRYFPVTADRDDAWSRYPQQRIGAVYLVRQPGESAPLALSAKCPHAGCFVGYQPGDTQFKCPCHTSAFQLDGTRARGDAEVSPRDMDTLAVELHPRKLADGSEVTEVVVELIDYQTGRKEKIPSA